MKWLLGKALGWVVGSVGGWPMLIAIGVVVAGVGGYIALLHWQKTGLERDLAQQQVELVAAQRDAAIYQAVNERNADAFKRYVAQVERDQALLADLAAAAIARTRNIDRIIMELEADENADWDRPLSGGLNAVLQRLRELGEGATAAGD